LHVNVLATAPKIVLTHLDVLNAQEIVKPAYALKPLTKSQRVATVVVTIRQITAVIRTSPKPKKIKIQS
jgi:hypothetical protein